MDSINARIDKLVIELFAGNNSKFAKVLNTNEANIRNYRSNREPKIEIINKIVSELEINYEWLLTGEGPMKQKEVNKIHHPKLREKELDEQSIPLYDIEAVAGLKALFDNTKENVLDLIHIPRLPKCDGAVYVTGDSMYPLLKSGDIVLYKEISDIPGSIYYGEMYLLSLEMEGDEYITVKYIHRSEIEGYIKLVSYNQHHEPKDAPISSIRAIALVKASIRMNTMS